MIYTLLFLLLIGQTNSGERIPKTVAIEEDKECPAQNDGRFIRETKTSQPLECDQKCSVANKCNSFLWNRRDSSCRLSEIKLEHNCFSTETNKFWFVKNFLVERASRVSTVATTTPALTFDNFKESFDFGNDYWQDYEGEFDQFKK